MYIEAMSDEPQIVLCTTPDDGTAGKIAELLVGERLAACVNIVPGITSIYQWKGGIEKAHERLLIIKTTRDVYASLQERINALHPYELPEIVAVPIENGLSEYLDWIKTSLK